MFNLFFIAIGAIVVGITVAIFATRNQAPGAQAAHLPEDDFSKDPKTDRALALNDLFQLAEALCKENGLSIKERQKNSEYEHYWIADTPNDFFLGTYVVGFLEVNESHRFVTLPEIMEFKDFIKSVGAAKGLFFTTGYFTKDVHQPLEGPKVSFFNRTKSLSEMKRLNLL